jgi:hypothetical protein
VARELDQLKPKMIVSDNRTELTSNAILQWADNHKVAWHYIARGKPVQNASPSHSLAGCATSCSTRRCSAHET